MSTATASPVWLARFLAPRHALVDCAIIQWHGVGEADTPGADARCRIHLACATDAAVGPIAAAAFSVFGPPVAVACADWLCEQVAQTHIGEAGDIEPRYIEQALALAPEERYAALLATDALASALNNLG